MIQFPRCAAVVIALLPVAAASAQPAETKPAAPAPATPAAGLPTGEELYAKHLAAMGGADAIKAKKTSLVKARITRSSGPGGLLTIWRQAPSKMYKTLDVPGVVTLETWCDGESAWMRNSNRGAARLSGDALAEVRNESTMAGDADAKSRYKSLVTTEKTIVNERPAYAVAAVTTDDKTRTLFFDAEKNFLIGVKISPAGKQPGLSITYSDYKESGGLLQPMTVVEDDGHTRSTVTYTQVEFDVPLVISLDPPSEVRSAK